jgi:hypothetical protein
MDRKTTLLLGAGIGLAAIIGGALYVANNRLMNLPPSPGPVSRPPVTNPGPPSTTAVSLRTVSLDTAPMAVQAAAKALQSSRIAYAVKSGAQTYLIVSTGPSGETIAAMTANAQPSASKPSFVDVMVQPNASGSRLLILAMPITQDAEFQVNLGGKMAAIPTLYNQHGLALMELNETSGFALINPSTNVTVQGDLLYLEGYARVFESSFSAKLLSAKGRVLAEAQVKAAAGAPNWGSFVTAMKLTERPTEATLVLFDEMSGAKLTIPVRFSSK